MEIRGWNRSKGLEFNIQLGLNKQATNNNSCNKNPSIVSSIEE